MARDYDTQLLESVAVRRGRMREALLWGRERRRLATFDNVKRLTLGVVLAAVVAAGCVGWSFVQQLLADQRAERERTTAPRTEPATLPSVIAPTAPPAPLAPVPQTSR